jgi:DNA-binding CsgD family transcriptional regulator/DNA-binding MarR family transcriptional regulator
LAAGGAGGIVTDVQPEPPVDRSDPDWPFVGREDQRRRIRAGLLDRRRSAVLAGPAGVGKSRLALEVLHDAERAGFRTAHVTATRVAGEIPLGVFAGLLPPVGEPGPGSVDSRADWLRRCVQRLAELGAGRPLVLLVDDVHLLDGASATMLQLAVGAGGCLLLGTLRTGEPVPDVITALWKDGAAAREDIAGLPVDDITRLLRTALADETDPATGVQLAAQSGGNALYLRELVRGALQAGTLVHRDGLWRLTGRAPLSTRLVELIETRLADLAPAERSLLELVAYGEPLGPAEIRALSGEETASGEELAEDLERRGFLTARRDGRRLRVRLVHPVYADALLSRMPALRRQRLARRLADVVEATGGRRREDVLRVATWRLEGGGARPDLMLRAASVARWSYEFPLAEQLARAAADDGAGFEARLLLAQLGYLQGHGDRAERQLAELAPTATGDEERARVALARLECAMFLGHIETGMRIAERAEAEVGDPGWRHQITARRAGLLLAASGPSAAVEVATPLLTASSGRALVWACLIASTGLGRLGRLDEAVAASDLGRRTQLDLPSSLEYYPWLHTYFRGDALLYAGNLGPAIDAAREQYLLGVRQRSPEAQAYFGFQLARSVGEHGDVDTAVRHARAAAAHFRELGRPALLEPCLVGVVVALALAGRADEAATALVELDELGLRRSYYTVEVLRARAWVALARGDLAEARDHLDRAVDLGQRIGDHVGALDAAHTLARIGHARRVRDRAAAIAGLIEGPLAAARLDHVTGLADRDDTALDAVSHAFEAMGAHLLAAEAAQDAVVAARDARPQRVAVLRRRAAALRRRCPRAVTPGLHAPSARTRLTPAEADAARLAAAGHSNRDIAAKLHLSVRTVEGQLQRSYEKLAVTNRAELAAALVEPDTDAPG